MSTEAMCWQLLTESDALRLRKLRRRERKRRQHVNLPRSVDAPGYVGDGPIFHEEGLA